MFDYYAKFGVNYEAKLTARPPPHFLRVHWALVGLSAHTSASVSTGDRPLVKKRNIFAQL